MIQRVRRVSRIVPAELADEPPSEAVVATRVRDPYQRPYPPPRAREGVPLSRSGIDRIAGLRGVGEGRRLLIVASGPSAARVNLEKLPTESTDTLLVNRPFAPLMDLARWWALNDGPIAMKYLEQLRAFPGQILVGTSAFVPGRDTIRVPVLAGRGFSFDLTQGFFLNRSTTASSLQFAVYAGYSSIFIVGLDMAEDAQLYHDGSAPLIPEKLRRDRFTIEAEYWMAMAQAMPSEIRRRVTIVSDVNPHVFVNLFNRASDLDAVEW